ncbi:MAG: hypothetical protein IJB96_11060 [Lachnospira sp.]|nr:hypothetical protein [Lachnospira sp.]
MNDLEKYEDLGEYNNLADNLFTLAYKVFDWGDASWCCLALRRVVYYLYMYGMITRATFHMLKDTLYLDEEWYNLVYDEESDVAVLNTDALTEHTFKKKDLFSWIYDTLLNDKLISKHVNNFDSLVEYFDVHIPYEFDDVIDSVRAAFRNFIVTEEYIFYTKQHDMNQRAYSVYRVPYHKDLGDNFRIKFRDVVKVASGMCGYWSYCEDTYTMCCSFYGKDAYMRYNVMTGEKKIYEFASFKMQDSQGNEYFADRDNIICYRTINDEVFTLPCVNENMCWTVRADDTVLVKPFASSNGFRPYRIVNDEVVECSKEESLDVYYQHLCRDIFKSNVIYAKSEIFRQIEYKNNVVKPEKFTVNDIMKAMHENYKLGYTHEETYQKFKNVFDTILSKGFNAFDDAERLLYSLWSYENRLIVDEELDISWDGESSPKWSCLARTVKQLADERADFIELLQADPDELFKTCKQYSTWLEKNKFFWRDDMCKDSKIGFYDVEDGKLQTLLWPAYDGEIKGESLVVPECQNVLSYRGRISLHRISGKTYIYQRGGNIRLTEELYEELISKIGVREKCVEMTLF